MSSSGGGRESPKVNEQAYRINERIRVPKVRLIDEEGAQQGVVSIEEALAAAKAAGLDLVEISPTADPPVARIMNYGKFRFQQNKQKGLAKKKQKQIKVKEIKFRPNTDKGDYEVKLRNLRGFLEEGCKVKVTVWFRGREMAHQELGIELLERVRTDLADSGKVEYFPKLEGRQLTMVIMPKPK